MAKNPNFVAMVLRYLHAIWQASFYLVSLGLLIAISFWTISNFQLTPSFTLDNYRDIFGKSRYLAAAGASLRLGLMASALAVIFALPVAHTAAFHLRGRLRHITLFMLLLPFFSSYVVRMFSWQTVLNDQGILAWLWRRLGGTGPLMLLFTEKAVLIGLLSVLIPIAALMIFLSLNRLDKSLILAARNLGASPWQTFVRVQLPFAMPGFLVSFLFCFILAFGDFVCSSILGGNQIYYLSIAIEDRTKINDLPTAAVLGTFLFAIALCIVAVSFGCINRLPGTVPNRTGGHR